MRIHRPANIDTAGKTVVLLIHHPQATQKVSLPPEWPTFREQDLEGESRYRDLYRGTSLRNWLERRRTDQVLVIDGAVSNLTHFESIVNIVKGADKRLVAVAVRPCGQEHGSSDGSRAFTLALEKLCTEYFKFEDGELADQELNDRVRSLIGDPKALA